MNAIWSDVAMPGDPADSEQRVRELLAGQIRLGFREQERARFIGQLIVVAALLSIGGLLQWAASSLGFGLRTDGAEMDRITTVIVAVTGSLLAGLVAFVWTLRLRLGFSELRLLQRELDARIAAGSERSDGPSSASTRQASGRASRRRRPEEGAMP